MSYLINLSTGDLTVDTRRTDLPLEYLCGFAARHNKKRGFLFASRVLGKYIAARPSQIRLIHSLLANKISAGLPGPIVVIGMAETAVALGHGVYDEYRRMNRRSDVVFLHSTRYRLRQNVAVEFLEEHSHAAEHIIYEPVDPYHKSLFERARTVVIVDDEATTGRTFVNLATALRRRMRSLQCVVTAVITDWRGDDVIDENRCEMELSMQSVEILAGDYHFRPHSLLQQMSVPKAQGNGQFKDDLLVANFGRLGICGQLVLPEFLSVRDHLSKNILVVGTGEFIYPPFLLAEKLEQAGANVYFQSTARSPILVEAAIKSRMEFPDNYDDGISNYLYNADGLQHDSIVVCHETPLPTLPATLLEQTGGRSLYFSEARVEEVYEDDLVLL